MSSKNSLQGLLVSLMAVAFVTGCAGPQPSSQEAINEALSMQTSTGVDEYVLGPTDAIQISVWRNADLSINVAVRPDGDLCGVLSERDIVRRIAQHGSDALALSVDEAMTREVVTATPDTSLDDALSQMTDPRIRHLPVVDQGKLVGIVSIGDLVKRKISATELEAEAMKQYIAAG